ncbi:FCD domain-containing protein [Desulfoluna spongiiphila]|uniref:FCD domain-containing protein n=2 Tax=Desulfoluna spongiiphila TaxID=419481 RepID=A0A1G5DYS4_9BACT|nr:FCD domain-containing protein [Desulfoluna spongiiphila]
MQLIYVYERMVGAAEQGDVKGVYDAIFAFAAIGLETAENPVLEKALLDLLPTMQRLQYISLVTGRNTLLGTLPCYKTIIDCLEARDVEGGARAMKAYVAAEKPYALASPGSPVSLRLA